MDKKQFLKQLAKELHKPVIRKFKRAQVITNGIDDVWAADLADMSSLASHNDNYKYLLTVIDVFSKYAWAVPVKDKTANTVLKAFQSIVQNDKRKPKRLWTDQGKEFINKEMKAWLKKEKISLYHTFGEHKASVVERFNRTLKTLMYKRFTEEQTGRWLEMLPELLEKYNNTKHSTIGATPSEVLDYDKDDVNALKEKLYGSHNQQQKKKNKFRLGDWVRISKVKRTFEKGYTPNWSHEVFKIVGTIGMNPTRYILEDYNKERIQGTFYAEELQKTLLNDIFLVREVLASKKIKGKKHYLVNWIGWPDNFKDWIHESELHGLNK